MEHLLVELLEDCAKLIAHIMTGSLYRELPQQNTPQEFMNEVNIKNLKDRCIRVELGRRSIRAIQDGRVI